MPERTPSGSPAEPRFARIAAAIGDASRARILARLLDGRCYTLRELGEHAGLAPATASAHMKRLVGEHLVRMRAQGRHHYFALADEQVAHALEALSLVADGGGGSSRWSGESMRPLRSARTCYGHLAGQLGVALHDGLKLQHWVEASQQREGEYRLTPAGAQALGELGLDVQAVAGTRLNRQRVLYACLDWSERRDHFAGPLAVAMLDHFVQRHWIARPGDSRALSLTPVGRRSLGTLLAG